MTYGYFPHTRPELDRIRFVVSSSEVDRYQALYPRLERNEIIDCMLEARPSRARLEALLAARQSAKTGA